MSFVQLAHGSGGIESAALIKDIFFNAFKSDTLAAAEDGAIIYNNKIVVSTDGYSVSPIFFDGGDIGSLAVCGSCNDVAMMGAKPAWLTMGCFIEEGFEIAKLKKIASSIGAKCEEIGVKIVSGDTKVVPKGALDGIYLHSCAIGELQLEGISVSNLDCGYTILVSRDIGTHGATIFSARDGIGLSSDIKSDCAHLWPIVKSLIDAKVEISSMRDATRGGLAAVLNEWAIACGVEIIINEQNLPISSEVFGICELLGFDACSLANEGTFVLAVKDNGQKALEILRQYNKNANIVGHVESRQKSRVLLNTQYGVRRILEYPSGELLPRIC